MLISEKRILLKGRLDWMYTRVNHIYLVYIVAYSLDCIHFIIVTVDPFLE